MVGTVALDGCPMWWTVKDGWKGESKEESWRNKEVGREGRDTLERWALAS